MIEPQWGKPIPMPENARALAIAQSHDWGTHAVLDGDRITGLTNEYTDADGVLHVETASIPATVTAVREFGRY